MRWHRGCFVLLSVGARCCELLFLNRVPFLHVLESFPHELQRSSPPMLRPPRSLVTRHLSPLGGARLRWPSISPWLCAACLFGRCTRMANKLWASQLEFPHRDKPHALNHHHRHPEADTERSFGLPHVNMPRPASDTAAPRPCGGVVEAAVGSMGAP